MKTIKKTMLVGLAAMATILFISCSKSSTSAPSTAIHLDSSATVSAHIVDKDGRSLYVFGNDANGLSNCTGGCLTLWIPYYADTITTTYGTGVNASDFKTMVTAAGTKQTTYKGWPLYYYAPIVNGVNTPEAAGLIGGEGVGGVWFMAKTNYSIMISNNQLVGADGLNYTNTYALGTGNTVYFNDGAGNTLYAFAPDSAYKNKYTKSDFSNNPTWPLYETSSVVVPSTLDKTLFVPITVLGHTQMTYKGWPMYYYIKDIGIRGANKGITVGGPGKVWPVIIKDAALAPR